jgi:hypothetical protein
MRTRYFPHNWACREADGFTLKPTGPGRSREMLYCPHCQERICLFDRRGKHVDPDPFDCDPYPGVKDWITIAEAARVAGVSRVAINQQVTLGGVISIRVGRRRALRLSLGQIKAVYRPEPMQPRGEPCDQS